MSIDTKTVQGRRELHFQSLAEMLADAERLVASGHTKTLGNWPLDQLLTHLASAINHSIDGISAKAPWFIRLLAPFLKHRILTRTMSPGFKLPGDVDKAFFPAVASHQEALQMFQHAIARLKNEQMTARHPVLGKLTHDEWIQFHLRHAELHLSFAIPG
jgi:hypothetical protein